VPGLLALARMRQEERERLFAEFEREWGDGRHEKLRENVEQVLVELGRHRALTAVEIERKYLLSGLPSASADARSVDVEQGWLPGTRLLERVRRVCSAGQEAYFRTMKLGTGLVRTEIEEETTKEVFDQLWPLTEGKRVRKRRYYVPDDDLIWELDEFVDRELALAEIELPSADTEVRVPQWLQPVLVREVTGEPEYVNVNLAR
jgi:adenylate cyclase